jgi:predicted phosphodiesterase
VSKHPNCKVCQAGILIDTTLTDTALGRMYGVHRKSIYRHRKHVTDEQVLNNPDPFFDVPSELITSRGKTVRLPDGSYEKIHYDPSKVAGVPEWPVIDRPTPIDYRKFASVSLTRKWKTAVAGADSQIGYRRLEDDTLDPFHDESAMALFTQLVEIENPERVLLCGDIIDLAEQGRWTQEAGFALTTQAAIDRTYRWLVDLRDATQGKIDLIEGNHDKRLQNFVEVNAKAAFGLKRAGWPDEWPVMSIPYLLRLDELDVTYYDAYPNAHVWVNNNLRAEHGTKINSNGSTAQKYLNETPHVSRLFGHTHRQEVVQRTTWDRLGKIRSQAINPGCLCRVDGAVPGVHGSIGANGKSAEYFEDWQQGAAVVRYTDDEFFVELVQFDEGRTVYQGKEIVVS